MDFRKTKEGKINIRAFRKVVVIAAAFLLIPLIAMQLTDEVVWTLSDFIFAWVMLIGFGSGCALLFGRFSSTKTRVLGALIALLFVWLWIELAVGLVTNWGT